jgi:hypothetical protein
VSGLIAVIVSCHEGSTIVIIHRRNGYYIARMNTRTAQKFASEYLVGSSGALRGQNRPDISQ